MEEPKYVTFKSRDVFELIESCIPDEEQQKRAYEFANASLVHDAVVIRRSDAFAPPALDAYANTIQMVIEAFQVAGIKDNEVEKLRPIADYFHDQAAKAWQEDRRLPD